MHQNPMQGNTLPLVDAVFLEREASPLVSSIDHLLGILSDPELVVSQAMVLNLIALRWIAFDVLRGHTMDTTWFHSSHPKDVHCKDRNDVVNSITFKFHSSHPKDVHCKGFVKPWNCQLHGGYQNRLRICRLTHSLATLGRISPIGLERIPSDTRRLAEPSCTG